EARRTIDHSRHGDGLVVRIGEADLAHGPVPFRSPFHGRLPRFWGSPLADERNLDQKDCSD
ncbi:MAG: hypothetical protein AB7V13_28305, partial [Pseudorhodoplanes sp.]